jgi:hypothetical protein
MNLLSEGIAMHFSQLLTDEEKWFFDHHGFLILRGIISAEEVAEMKSLGEEWHSRLTNLPAPLYSSSREHPDFSPNIAHWINRIEYGHPVFERLALNPEVLRVVIALTHGYPTLVDTALTRNTTASDDIRFHEVRGGYRMLDGEPFANFLNAGIALVDVPADTGFVCIPGSHKDHFLVPDSIGIYDTAPSVFNPSVRAGDCVLFTEALRHGARRWTASTPRFTIFNRYKAGDCEGRPLPEFQHLVSEDLYELGTSLPMGQEKNVVRRFLDSVKQDTSAHAQEMVS